MVLGRWARQWGIQVLISVGAMVPLVLLVWDFANGQLTADPIREAILRTGRYALILLFLSLTCTPLYTVSGLKQVRRLRRPLGLAAFLYAAIHLLAFAGLDYGFALPLIGQEIAGKRFIQIGLAALAILTLLALTSTRGWTRRLGRNWERLHRLAYLAGLLAVVHFLWVVKGGVRRPLPYAAWLAVVLILRIPPVRDAVARLRMDVGRRFARTAHG